MVTLCRASIFPDWPVSIVPLGLFCHSGPVLGQIKQRIQCFRMRSDLRHLQAIPSKEPIFARRIHRHRDTFLREPCSLRTNGIHALAVPDADQKFKMECSSELEHCRNLCQSADSKVERM